MSKKILRTAAVIFAAVLTVMLAGCSEYKMTPEDLAIQNSIKGYWLADDSLGYNSYDSEGNPLSILIVEFTDDFNYFIHQCSFTDGYTMTSDPISYSFKNEKFRVDVDGVASYAKISVSGDGKTMSWITDKQTEIYHRVEEEAARAFGIPEYNGGNAGSDNSGTDTDSSEE